MGTVTLLDYGMAHGSSRRNAIRALGLAAAGAALVTTEAGATPVAPQSETGSSCKRDGDCSEDAICRKGRCVCRDGYHRCKGRCIDFGSNNNHCGRCGRGCLATDTCSKGRCIPVMA